MFDAHVQPRMERRLLRAALAANGEIEIRLNDTMGEYVSIGGQDYVDGLDPQLKDAALRAFDSLFGCGLIEYERGSHFKLTRLGSETALDAEPEASDEFEFSLSHGVRLALPGSPELDSED